MGGAVSPKRVSKVWMFNGLRMSSAVVVHRTYKPWVWGPHWLYKNDMDWLIQFLNDDEKALQKIGLGMPLTLSHYDRHPW